MEEHFLREHIQGEPGFSPEPWYNEPGDCVLYRTVNEAVYADRIDSLVTLHRSVKDDKVIGFQVKGVRTILQAFDGNILTVGA